MASELPSLGYVVGQLSIVGALVLANGFFVASEFALVSVRRTRIDQLAAEGNSSAIVVQKAVRDLDRYIAATQVGITVASLLLGGIGEPALHHMLEPVLTMAGLPKEGTAITSSAVALGLAYFIMTALHVIVGELMPKSIALQQPDKVSLLLGRPMMLAAKLFTPLIWLLNETSYCAAWDFMRRMVTRRFIRRKNWICFSRNLMMPVNSRRPNLRFCTVWCASPTSRLAK
jgi:CBS domain containing-hemolysin-like protein